MKDYALTKVDVVNVMACKAFHWEGGKWGLVSIKGDNGAGKSSALKGLIACLAGKRAMPPEILREGAQSWRSEVVLQTLDGTETLTVIAGGKKGGAPSVRVLDGEGRAIAAPQSVLDSIVSGEQLDPLKLLQAKPAEQQKMLLRAMGCGFDLDKWTVERKQVYDERTEVNRRLKAVELQAAGLMDRAEATAKSKAVVPDSAEIAARMQAAIQHNGDIDAMETNIGMKDGQIVQQQSIIRSLKLQLKKAEDSLHQMEDARESMALDLAEMEPVDDVALREEYAGVQQAGAARERAKSALARWADADLLGAESEELTRGLALMDAEREDALKGLELPVEGLQFTDAGLLYQGFTLQQTATGDALTVAVGLAAGLQPHLRLVCIDEGSVLDKAHWATLGRISEEQKLNIVVLAVDHGQDGILIEDGEVVS